MLPNQQSVTSKSKTNHQQYFLMQLIIQLIIFTVTFKLGSTVPVNNDSTEPNDQHEAISYERISGHSGINEETKPMVKRLSVSPSSVNTKLNQHLFPFGLTSLSSVDVDGFKLVQSQQKQQQHETIDAKGQQLRQQLPAQHQQQQSILAPYQYHSNQLISLDKMKTDQPLFSKPLFSPLSTNMDKDDFTIISTNTKLISSFSPSSSSSSSPSSSSSIISIPSTASKISTQIHKSSMGQSSSSSATTKGPSSPSPVDVNSLIQDSVQQATQLLIDLEEQVKLGINQGIEDYDYEPLNIFPSSSKFPPKYSFQFSPANFLFRPLIRVSSSNLQPTGGTGVGVDPNDDDINNPSVLDSMVGTNENVTDQDNDDDDNNNSNKQGTGIQVQSMIDEVNRVELNVETLISELVSNRRYVTAAVFRSLLNYLRRTRISLERLQSRMAIIGVGTSQQGIVSSISSGLSSSVSSFASSMVPNSFLADPVSGPLGGSSGAAAAGGGGAPSIVTSYLEAIRVRMDRITDEIKTLVNRLRANFSSPPSANTSSPSPSAALQPLPTVSSPTTSNKPS